MQVTAAVTPGPGQDFVLQQVELDEPRADEILVRIAAVGVCHTDLVAREGAMPFSLSGAEGRAGRGGHSAAGDARARRPGDDADLRPDRAGDHRG